MMGYILLVEDSKDNADMIIHILTSAHYEVRHFSRGLPAAQEARRHKPELILMDFNLPDVDGRTLSKVLMRQLGGVESPPIIACTARVGTIETKLAEQFGCAAFLRKPFSPEDLLALVQRFIPTPADS
jgi:two-component system cell cycle response regulator DivK